MLTYRFKIQSYKRINGHDTQTYLIHNQCYKKINIHNFEKIQNYDKTINIKKINGSIKPADIILKSQSYRKSRTHFWKFNATIKPADTIFQKARFSLLLTATKIIALKIKWCFRWFNAHCLIYCTYIHASARESWHTWANPFSPFENR